MKRCVGYKSRVKLDEKHISYNSLKIASNGSSTPPPNHEEKEKDVPKKMKKRIAKTIK
jgi:hypothetical protein